LSASTGPAIQIRTVDSSLGQARAFASGCVKNTQLTRARALNQSPTRSESVTPDPYQLGRALKLAGLIQREHATTSRLTKPHRSRRKSMPHNKKPRQLGVSFTSARFVKTASKRRDGEDALKRSVLVSAATLVYRSAGWACEHLLRESLVHERFSPLAKNCANSLDERQAAPVSDNTMVFWLFPSLVGLMSGLRAIGLCAREI